MSVFRRVAPALACLILGGCWKGPAPLKGEETDAYGWRAALTVDAADSLYRFDIPSELQQWMTQHDAQVPAVFDADGRPMMCSTLRGYNGALDSIAHTVQGRVGAFDPDRCRDSNLRVCFKDGECVPDYCPHVTVDVPAGSIGDLQTPEELLAVANAEIPHAPFCRPIALQAPRDCTVADDAALEQSRQAERRVGEARSALRRGNLGEETKSDEEIEEAQRARREHRAAKTVVRLPVPNSMLTGVPKPPQLPYKLTPRETRPLSIESGFVIEFDEPPREFRLVWSRPAEKFATTARLAAYGENGRPIELREGVYPGPEAKGDTFEQLVRSDPKVRAYHVAVEPEVTGLVLLGATSTTHQPKPFVQDGHDHYWFSASGRAPYFVYLEHGRGRCGTGYDSRQFADMPRAADPDWPLVARVGAIEANPRSPSAAFMADHRDVLGWLQWGAMIGAAWLVALFATLARWLWVAYGSADRRR